MAQQQKAALLLAKQGKIEVGTRPIPSPQGKQALVKVTAAAINPVDWKIVDTGFIITEFPAVLGMDGAGIIESVGPEVTDFKKGDKIFFQGNLGSSDEQALQQYALADTEIISKIPDNISDEQAATFPIAAMTAVVGLFQQSGIAFPEHGPTAAGKPILILGGSSSVGQYTIQLARIAGFSPIVTTSSAQHTEYLKSLGATHVLDRNADVKTIQKAFPTPVALVYDAISAPSTQSLAFDVLTTPSPVPGTLLALASFLDPAVQAKNETNIISIHQIIGSAYYARDLAVPFWRSLGKWIKDGKIVPNRVHLVKGGLAAVPEALDLSRKGVSGVKLVIRPQE